MSEYPVGSDGAEAYYNFFLSRRQLYTVIQETMSSIGNITA